MAKAQGIIGNFKGKVGNMVGYQLTDSNNKQTQGIRIYQPNVKNPKTLAQAEQRAKLAPINATYRALKMIIDRGNEGLPYGNKSRLAWLKQAFKAEIMPWFEKGAVANMPVACQLTKGSLPSISFTVSDEGLNVSCPVYQEGQTAATIGGLSTILKNNFPFLQDSDQITFVVVGKEHDNLMVEVMSYVIDTTSAEATSKLEFDAGTLSLVQGTFGGFGTIIVSREGSNGEHLRSTSALQGYSTIIGAAPYDATSKTAAIESYMASGAANTDWAEESIK